MCRGRYCCPHQPDGQLFAIYKVSKRFEQDISAVCGAFALQLDGTTISTRADLFRRHGGHTKTRHGL